MKTSTVVFGSIVVAGAGVQGAPFFGVPSDLSLSALIGRGLSADSHNPESKPVLFADDKHLEQKGHKDDNAGHKDHKDEHHTDKASQGKNRGLAVNLGMDMGMCANVMINGVLTQDCSARNPKHEGSSKQRDPQPHDRDSESTNGKPKEDHHRNSPDQPKNNDAQCQDTVVSMKMRMQMLQSDNDNMRSDISKYKRKVAEYERKLALFEESKPDDKKHLVARNHRYSSNDHEHRTPDEHDHRGDQGHHSLSSSVHTGGGIKVENHHSESNGSSHHRGDKGDYRHHGDGQYGLERFRGDDSHHGSNHKSGFDPEPGRDERYLSDEFPQRSQTSSRHGDNHNDSEAQHRKDVYDNYRYFDDALLGERDGSRSPDRSSDEAHEHRGQKHGKHGVLEDLRGFYRPEDRGKAHGGEHDHHRTDSRGYLDNDFFDRSGRGTKHHDNEYRPGQTFGNNFRHTEDEERGSKRYDPSYSLDDGQQSQGRGLSSFGQELDDWYGQGNRGISNGSPRSSRDHGPFEDGYFGHGRQSNPKSGRDRDNEGGVYFGKGLRGTYQPIEQELQESRRPSESYRYRDSRPSSDTSSGFSNELEDWYGPDGNRAEPPNKGRGRDQYDYIPFERENKSDRSQQAQGGAERSDTGLDHDLRKGGKAVSGGLTREAGLTRNKADGGKTSSESSPRKKEKGSQGGLRKEGEFYQQDIKKDRAHVNEDLQKEDDFVDQSLKKDGKHIDKAPHNGSQEMDDGLHQNGSKADKGLHSEAKKVDKNAHSDTNDVDDDMHEDGKKIDYQLHDYGNGLAGLEHDATSGSKSGKNEQKEEKERTKSDDKILKELFSDTEKEGKKSGPSKQDSRKDGQENVFKPKTVHIGIAGESLNHI